MWLVYINYGIKLRDVKMKILEAYAHGAVVYYNRINRPYSIFYPGR